MVIFKFCPEEQFCNPHHPERKRTAQGQMKACNSENAMALIEINAVFGLQSIAGDKKEARSIFIS